MKLLLDQNLSRKLVKKIRRTFSQSSHVIFCGLEGRSDDEIWAYAHRHGFLIVTKDADFSALSSSRGFPPKVIWLRIGNVASEHVEAVLKARAKDIRRFGSDTKSGCLVIYE